MRKLLAILVFIVVMFAAGKLHAQLSINLEYSPINYHYNYSSQEINIAGNTYYSSPTTLTMSFFGISAGASYAFSLKYNLDISIGGKLRWNHKYAPMTTQHPEIDTVMECIHDYLFIDIPLIINYDIWINHKCKLSPFIGTILSYNLFGTITTNYFENRYDITTGQSYKPEKTKNSYHEPLNIYGIGGASFSYSHFDIYGGYRLGLLNLSNNDFPRITTSGLFVGLAYTF